MKVRDESETLSALTTSPALTDKFCKPPLNLDFYGRIAYMTGERSPMSEIIETSISFHDQLVCEDSDPPLAVSLIRAMLNAALVILEGNG